MSQASPTIGSNKPGLTYRNEDNAGKQALLSSHKGSSAPSYAMAGTIWLDDNTTPWLLKLYDGADWITIGAVNATTNAFTPFLGTSALKTLNFASDSGAADAYAVAPVPAISSYAAGQLVTLMPANTNTGAATLAVSGLSAINIKLLDGSNPHAGALQAGGIYHLVYNGTNFILLNPYYAFGGLAFLDILNEDDFATMSETRPPSQKSVADYVAANASGVWKDIGLIVASSASSVVFNDLPDDCTDFQIVGNFTGTANTTLGLRLSTDNGSSFVNSGSAYQYGSDTDRTGGGTLSTYIQLGNSPGAANLKRTLVVDLYGLSSDSESFVYARHGVNGMLRHDTTAGARIINEIHDAIQIFPNSGSITGEFRIYGRKNIT